MSATTIAMNCTSPAPARMSSDARPMTGGATFALVAAWTLFAVAMCLPVANGLPGILFVAANAIQLMIGCTGNIGSLIVGTSFLPNVAMFLSPLLFVPAIRGSKLIGLFRMMGALSVLAAMLFSVIFGSTKGGIGIGYAVWTLSMIFLAVGISTVSGSQKRA
ncbi:MAG: hypothetical protein K8T20_07125 [Planctomycetes bacterium]|nr:hypothetical protein [Planctomycetota bacterium]